MNIWVAGGAILIAGSLAIVAVLAKMAVKEIRHPQREIQLPLPDSTETHKQQDHELTHV
jgi:hypothetical protein